MNNQEAIWRDTLADDTPDIEKETRQGGLTPTEVNHQLLFEIHAAVSRLVGKARQLLGNSTTNLAECWMHIRAKFDGGKVINRSQSGSWQHRCMGAGLRQNMGREWGPQVWKIMTQSSPNKVYTDEANDCAKIVERDRKRKATEQSKETRRRSKYMRTDDTLAARKAYSRHDNCITPDEIADDIPTEQLEQLKTSFYKTKVVITEDKVKEIEKSTQNQANDEQWMFERRLRITASKAGSIAKMRNSTKRSKKVQELLYSKFRGNEATRYGSTMEEGTIQHYVTYQQRNGHPGLKVKKCGLFVSIDNMWLAASPDGLVHDPQYGEGLLEMKNPHSARDKSLAESCTQPTFCLKEKDNTFTLKVKHDYHFQIQCQLYCANRNWCDFVLKTNMDIHVERIYRDEKWWNEQLKTLRKFYFTALLPELASPRHNRGGIREVEGTTVS